MLEHAEHQCSRTPTPGAGQRKTSTRTNVPCPLCKPRHVRMSRANHLFCLPPQRTQAGHFQLLEYQDLPRKWSWCSSPSLDHPWGVEALNHALWVIVGALYPWLHNTSSFPLPTIPLPAQMLLCCADMGTQVPSQQPCPVCSHSDSFCHGS